MLKEVKRRRRLAELLATQPFRAIIRTSERSYAALRPSQKANLFHVGSCALCVPLRAACEGFPLPTCRSWWRSFEALGRQPENGCIERNRKCRNRSRELACGSDIPVCTALPWTSPDCAGTPRAYSFLDEFVSTLSFSPSTSRGLGC